MFSQSTLLDLERLSDLKMGVKGQNEVVKMREWGDEKWRERIEEKRERKN